VLEAEVWNKKRRKKDRKKGRKLVELVEITELRKFANLVDFLLTQQRC
jgi:hypothetical protein